MVMSLPSPSRIVQSLFPSTKQGASAGCELVTADGRTLALTAAALRVDARGGIARCVLEQRFENKFEERLHVTYRMPLPADGAVSGYAFTIGDRVVRGVVDRKQKARERFERAIATGHTAGLLEQERADIFTQSLGNIPPGEAITVAIEIDQRLVWLPEGEWELRFPTVIGPRYIGTADTMNDARATHVKVTTQPLGVQVSAHVVIGDAITGGRRATSPTHSLTKDANGALSLGGGVRLDRDIVVRWPVAAPSPGLSLSTARPNRGDESFGLLAIVPPARDAKATPVARDLIVLLDTSGSMDGGPLEKAKQVVALMIDSLDERDRFELIEFNYRPSRYQEEPEHATAAAKKAAIKWVSSRRADGGTEMRAGVLEALKTLRIGAQRQVLVVTDGYVGGEHQILMALQQRLPASCRLHVLGVGSAVNRSLAIALARVGRGTEVLVGIDEDAERGAKRLLDRTTLPMLTNVTISGDALVAHAPEQIPDVFEASPCVAALMLSTEGGEIIVRGETASGSWEQRTRVLPLRAGEGNQAIVALYGRERVADLEARTMLDPADAMIEEVGLQFQIATRLTSWIAVDETRVVKGPERTQNVPQELPYGTKAQSFGLRGASNEPHTGHLGDTSRMQAVSGRVSRALEVDALRKVDIDDFGEAGPSTLTESEAFEDLDEGADRMVSRYDIEEAPAPASYAPRSIPARPGAAMPSGPASMRPPSPGYARPAGAPSAPAGGPPAPSGPPAPRATVTRAGSLTRTGAITPPADDDFEQEAATGQFETYTDPSAPSFEPSLRSPSAAIESDDEPAPMMGSAQPMPSIPSPASAPPAAARRAPSPSNEVRPPRPTEASPMPASKTGLAQPARPNVVDAPDADAPSERIVTMSAMEDVIAPEDKALAGKSQAEPAPLAPAPFAVAPEPELGRRRSPTLTGVAAPSSAPQAGFVAPANAPTRPSMVTRSYVASEAEMEAAAKNQAPYKRPPRFALWLIIALVMAIIAALVWWLAS
jgi:Ca-activated chloride channel family protein